MTRAQPKKPTTATKQRAPQVELKRAMEEAAQLSVAALAERALIRNPDDPQYVRSEVLAHRIRVLHRTGNIPDMNRLARPFVERMTAMLRARATGIYGKEFEDFAHRVHRSVFQNLLSSSDEYTFYEIAFNRTLRLRRLDAYATWLAEKRTQELETSQQPADIPAGEDYLDRSDDPHVKLRQWELDPFEHVLKSQRWSLAIRRMADAGLTKGEMTALILAEVMEMEVASNDATKKTIAKHLGVTDRTVRNLISRAKEKLRGKE